MKNCLALGTLLLVLLVLVLGRLSVAADRPNILLMSQHKAPHREWAPALRHLGWNGDRRFPELKTLFDEYAGRGLAEREQDMSLEKTFTARDAKLTAPPYLNEEQLAVWNAFYEPLNEEFRHANLSGKELVRWRYQRYMHDYLGTVKAVDEAVGKLLDYLDQEGIADQTVVIFSSDQGFYLGEHGWFDKRWIYEESLTTPLLVRWPGVTNPGSRSSALASVLGLPETMLEIAGQSVPDNPAYSQTVKQLHAELDRLRAELQFPAEDPPGSIRQRPRGANAKAPNAAKGRNQPPSRTSIKTVTERTQPRVKRMT